MGAAVGDAVGFGVGAFVGVGGNILQVTIDPHEDCSANAVATS